MRPGTCDPVEVDPHRLTRYNNLKSPNAVELHTLSDLGTIVEANDLVPGLTEEAMLATKRGRLAPLVRVEPA
jgi:hypothetical protein